MRGIESTPASTEFTNKLTIFENQEFRLMKLEKSALIDGLYIVSSVNNCDILMMIGSHNAKSFERLSS